VDAAAQGTASASGLLSMAFRRCEDEPPPASAHPAWMGGRADELGQLGERVLALLDGEGPERDVEVAEEALAGLRLAAAGAPEFLGEARLLAIAAGGLFAGALEAALAARVVDGEPEDARAPRATEVAAIRLEAAALLEEIRIAHRETTP